MVRYVVAALAAVLLVCVVGIILLALKGQPIPDILQNLAVGALTGLTGVLVSFRGGGEAPTEH